MNFKDDICTIAMPNHNIDTENIILYYFTTLFFVNFLISDLGLKIFW